MKKHIQITLFVTMAVLLVALTNSCDNNSNKTRGADVKNHEAEARSLLRKLQGAVLDGNKASYIECFTEDTLYRDVVGESYELLRAIHEFERQLTNSFGADALGEYSKFGGGRASRASLTITGIPEDKSWADKIVLFDGLESTSFINPQSGLTNRIIYVAHGPKIEAKTLLPDGSAPQQAVGFARRMTQLLRLTTTNKIPAGNISIEELKEWMADEFFGRNDRAPDK